MSHSQEQHEVDNTTTSSIQQGCLLTCRCESARSVSTLLSSLKHVHHAHSVGLEQPTDDFGHATPMTVFCSPTSITFHVVGKARQSQASVDMQAGLFSHYRVLKRKNNNNTNSETHDNDDNDWQAGGEFCVNLVTVLECLSVLGSSTVVSETASTTTNTPLCMSYDLDTEIFRLELLNDAAGVLSTAAIPGVQHDNSNTNDGESSLAYAFRSSPVMARMICNSGTLREAMQELDLVHGATCCTVALSSQQGLELAAVGNVGECLISLPASSTLSLESQSVKAQTYPIQSLKSGMRALDIAQETCVSINEAGMMAIQHQVLDTVGSGSPNFVDFIMGCLQEEDDDEQQDEQQEEASQDYNSVALASDHPLASQRSATQLSMSWNDDNGALPRILPQDRSVVSTRTSRNNDEIDDNSRESDSDNDLPPASSAIQSLYGTVVVGKTASPTKSVTRSKRQTRSRPMRDTSQEEYSQSLLSDKEQEESDNESQPLLDVTAPARPKRGKRYSNRGDDGSSSPEVGYGPDMTQDDF